MYQALQHNIELTIGRSLSLQESERLPQFFKLREAAKHTIFNPAGEVVTNAFFILKGSAFSYLTDAKGQRHVVRLAIENMWIVDLSSYFSGNPSKWTLETLEPTRALVLSKEDADLSFNELSFMDRYFRIHAQQAYVALQERLTRVNAASAEERYMAFANERPELLQRIPQYLIASYLGIQPESLSRIRSKLSKA
jgi:CRP-like cAMP-binding protein